MMSSAPVPTFPTVRIVVDARCAEQVPELRTLAGREVARVRDSTLPELGQLAGVPTPTITAIYANRTLIRRAIRRR